MGEDGQGKEKQGTTAMLGSGKAESTMQKCKRCGLNRIVVCNPWYHMQVYNALEEQADSFARQAGHSAYIFEASAQNHRKISGLMVRLLRVVIPGPQPQDLVVACTPLRTVPPSALFEAGGENSMACHSGGEAGQKEKGIEHNLQLQPFILTPWARGKAGQVSGVWSSPPGCRCC